MFFADKPYVSDFFRTSVRDNGIPVVDTDTAKEMGLHEGTRRISEDEAIETIQRLKNPILYTTSENAIGWLAAHLKFSDLPGKIELFKNKLKFRELTKSLFPDFYFKGISVQDLEQIDFNRLPLPFIIKPIVGFFSMGVYKVSNRQEWGNTIGAISKEIDQVKDLYPQEVMDPRAFIIEQCIVGDEFAVDAYFNGLGEPVVLNILEHVFSSDSDVSDRVYMTSKKIIEENIKEFTEFAAKIGCLAGVKNFPVHIELRRDRSGNLLPIEINPMRFGGWCTTPDLAYLAYGFNPYLYYYLQKRPDWSEVLKGKENRLFSVVVLDNSTGLKADEIESFDYERLISKFERPMELRKIDFRKYPVFGFLFTDTRQDNFIELKNILDSDLTEFITARSTGENK